MSYINQSCNPCCLCTTESECAPGEEWGKSQQELNFSATVTQLWPAVIEILSMVLCDYRSNEFSMAVIFSLLVFSLQVKTCRIKMTKTTHVHHVDVQITTNCLTVAVSVWKKTHSTTPIKLCKFFFSYFIYRFSFP